MKHLILPLLLVVCLNTNYASVSSKITDITVYQQGARITSEATFSLKPGNNEIIITDITTGMDANSIQARLSGNAILLSATSRTRQKEDKELPKRTKSLEDSILLTQNKINWLTNQREVYHGEAVLITENQKLGTTQEKASVDEIIQLSNFYRSRLLDIKKKTYQIDIDLKEQNELKKELNRKLNALKHSEKKYVGEIILSISSKTETRVKAKISYLTRNAGWSPIYDIRATQADQPIDLVYKANVYQTTGYAWNNIDLVISTGNPTANNTRPTMYPWYINFFEPIPITRQSSRMKSAKASTSEMMFMEDAEADFDMELGAADEVMAAIGYDVSTKENSVATEYTIEIAQDIPSDGKQHLVAIKNYKLDAKFTYHAIPKLNPSTFLVAKVADYGQYNLLPGQSNLFFDGMYLGKSYLNPVTTSDSLLLSLGRDEKIIVKRKQLTDLTKKQSLGNNIREIKAFEITVRNNNSYAVELDLMDQVPISQNQEIEVKLEEQNGAIYDENYGSLLWKLSLAPNESKQVKFIYSVKYPKNKTITGL